MLEMESPVERRAARAIYMIHKCLPSNVKPDPLTEPQSSQVMCQYLIAEKVHINLIPIETFINLQGIYVNVYMTFDWAKNLHSFLYLVQ